ncbi:MAG TPA: hypothetical protein VJ770_21735 [Stellaceae bacterium]|nr:hypothetical protein [Stellaceae bacterium]
MKKLLLGLAAVPFLFGLALAAEPLNDTQLDRITAGDSSGTACPGAGCTSSTTTSNGVTTTVATTGFQITVNPGDFNAVLQSFYAYLASTGFKLQP